MIRAAHLHARSQGISVSAALVDQVGLLQALGRMDNTSPANVEVSLTKTDNSAFAPQYGGRFRHDVARAAGNLEALGDYLGGV